MDISFSWHHIADTKYLTPPARTPSTAKLIWPQSLNEAWPLRKYPYMSDFLKRFVEPRAETGKGATQPHRGLHVRCAPPAGETWKLEVMKNLAKYPQDMLQY